MPAVRRCIWSDISAPRPGPGRRAGSQTALVGHGRPRAIGLAEGHTGCMRLMREAIIHRRPYASSSGRAAAMTEAGSSMRVSLKLAVTAMLIAVALNGSASAQTNPEGEMRFALYVTIAPAWLDPGETGPGNLTPFWMLYALHDALVKPMPGDR